MALPSDPVATKHMHLLGGAPADSDCDASVQQHLSTLLTQWGSDIINDDVRLAARVEVERMRQEKRFASKQPQPRLISGIHDDDESDRRQQPQPKNGGGPNKKKELFIYNPYRPQGGMGFRGTPMWENLLAELPESNGDSTAAAQLKQRVAQIFRIDAAHNAAVEKKLVDLDTETEVLAQQLIEKAKKEVK